VHALTQRSHLRLRRVSIGLSQAPGFIRGVTDDSGIFIKFFKKLGRLYCLNNSCVNFFDRNRGVLPQQA
jgi:hypothetical protein